MDLEADGDDVNLGSEPSHGQGLRGFRRRWTAATGDLPATHESMNTPLGEGLADDVPDDWFSTGGTPDFSPVPSPSIHEAAPIQPVHNLVMEDLSGMEIAWKDRALETASKRARVFRTKQPWESSHFNGVFGPTEVLQGTVIASSSNLLLPTHIGLRDVLNTQIGTVRQALPDNIFGVVSATNLKYARRELPDEDVRRAALDRLRSLLVLDVSATHLGLSLQQIADRTSSPELIEQSVKDCFRAKASSTLQKRASSLWRLSKLLLQVAADSPLNFSEEQLYDCLCILRDRGSGATSAQHILEALWFLDGTAKFVTLNLAVIVSGRCRGVARDLYLRKNPLQQKQPLTVKQVKSLESLMNILQSRDQCILGQILFCIHACCRWKDSQRVKSISLESGGGEVLVYCEALSSKTSLTAEAQTRFLPYVALGSGINKEDWATVWVQARASENFNSTDYWLPSFSERQGSWVDAPMSSSEATCYMRDFLLESGVDRETLKNFGSHSCKTTILTWAGRSNIVQFSATERRQLGHHMKPGTKSILTYSREAYTTLYGKVLAMFKTIRNGSFDPDLAAVDRLVQTSNNVDGTLETEVPELAFEESDSDSSLGSEHDLPVERAKGEGVTSHRVKGFFGVSAESLVVHRISGVVHVANEDSFLLCGRRPSANFVSYLDCESDHPNVDCCAQCLKALKRPEANE